MSLIIAVVFAAAFFAIGIYFKWYNKPFDCKNKSHITLLCAAVAFFVVVATLIFLDIYKPSASYPFTESVTHFNAYEQQFDAFLKGQLNIDYPASEQLLSLENPYDRIERTNAHVYYLWDRAFYNGNYYSYFGAAPILTIYYPFYLITGKIASASVVCYILAIITIVSVAFLAVKASMLLCKKVNFVLLFLSIFATEFGSLLFMMLTSADMYYIAMLSGVCNLSMFLLFTVSAMLSRKYAAKCIQYFAAGIFLILTVMSRPNMALLGLITVPFYLHIFTDKKFKISRKVIQIISFAVPVLIGAAVQMWYNNARFSSPFDFGSDYQLTVADVSQYTVTGLLFLPAIYHYFLQAPVKESYFPYFHLQYNPYKGYYSGYLYNTITMGTLWFPAASALVLTPYELFKKNPLWKKSFFCLTLLLPITLAFLDTCLGGVNIRYLADILFVMVFAGAILLLDFYNAFENSKKTVKIAVFTLITLILMTTAWLGACMIFENERYSFFQ